MRAVAVQHVPFEGPAMIAQALADAGCAWTSSVPISSRTYRMPQESMLVVMGGPMGALDDSEHPHLERERSLLKACVQRDMPVLGVPLARSCSRRPSARACAAARRPRSA